MNTKAQVRHHMRQKLRELPSAFKQKASEEICRHVAEKLARIPGKKIAIFAALPSEPNLAPLHAFLPEHEIHYPLCDNEGIMTFHHAPHPKQLEAGKHGILAPDPTRHPIVIPQELDIIFCPGIAFTKSGHRLGQGGGYYDRYLPQAVRAEVIGVAFSMQIIPEIPCLAHDHLVHKLVTEIGFLSRKEDGPQRQ